MSASLERDRRKYPCSTSASKRQWIAESIEAENITGTKCLDIKAATGRLGHQEQCLGSNHASALSPHLGGVQRAVANA